VSLLKDIIKKRNWHYGKYNAYPAKLILQSYYLVAELRQEYLAMKINKETSSELVGTPFEVDETLTVKFEFRGNRSRWDDDD